MGYDTVVWRLAAWFAPAARVSLGPPIRPPPRRALRRPPVRQWRLWRTVRRSRLRALRTSMYMSMRWRCIRHPFDDVDTARPRCRAVKVREGRATRMMAPCAARLRKRREVDITACRYGRRWWRARGRLLKENRNPRRSRRRGRGSCAAPVQVARGSGSRVRRHDVGASGSPAVVAAGGWTGRVGVLPRRGARRQVLVGGMGRMGGRLYDTRRKPEAGSEAGVGRDV